MFGKKKTQETKETQETLPEPTIHTFYNAIVECYQLTFITYRSMFELLGRDTNRHSITTSKEVCKRNVRRFLEAKEDQVIKLDIECNDPLFIRKSDVLAIQYIPVTLSFEKQNKSELIKDVKRRFPNCVYTITSSEVKF